jgi:hypothetical protein
MIRMTYSLEGGTVGGVEPGKCGLPHRRGGVRTSSRSSTTLAARPAGVMGLQNRATW